MTLIAATLPLSATIVIAVAPSVVAVVALIVAGKQQERTLRHERLRDDLREARSILDDAAKGLANVDDIRRDFIGDYHNVDKRVWLGEQGKLLDVLRSRIAIRFGRKHELTSTFEECIEAMLELFAATRDKDSIDPQRVVLANDDFERWTTAFVDAATARAGIELDPPASKPRAVGA